MPLWFCLPKMAGRVPSLEALIPAWDTSIIQEPREARQAKAVTAETSLGTMSAKGRPLAI